MLTPKNVNTQDSLDGPGNDSPFYPTLTFDSLKLWNIKGALTWNIFAFPP